MDTVTILVLTISAGWLLSVGALAWITRLHEKERREANDKQQAYLLTAMQYALLARAQDPTATAYAIREAQAPFVTPEYPVEQPPDLPPIVGFKTADGQEIEFTGDVPESILNGADEERLIREE